MKIDFIELKNYRQYKDATIEFSKSEKQNFSVIQGVTGAGKTNLLNAITWCLYGEEKHLGRRYEGFPLVNTVTLGELETGERCRVVVRVVMKDKDDKKLIFERVAEFQKLKSGIAQEIGVPKFKVFKQNRNIERVDNPEYILSGLMPESIEEYFFFDGERLNAYFESESSSDIRDAVFRISQIGLLENAIKHLESMKNEFLRTAKDLTPEAEKIKKELVHKEKPLKQSTQELTKLKREKIKAEKNEKEYSKKLITSSTPNVRVLEEERKQIEEDLDKLKQDIEEYKRERLDYLVKIAPSIVGYEAILKTKELIEKGKEAGDIPPKLKRGFLKKLLKKGKCICGTDISEGSDCRKAVKELLQESSRISDISTELIEEHGFLETIIDDLEEFHEKRIGHGKKINKMEKKRHRKSKRLKEIEEKLRSSDSDLIKKWEARLMHYKNVKGKLTVRIALLEDGIKKTTEEIDELNKALDRELRKERKCEILIRKRDFCGKALVALGWIKEEIIGDIRKKVERNTKDQFLSLIWKKQIYKDVKINEDYSISVVDQYGREGLGTFSAGENQLLALSFIAALNSVSGFDAPIIIDTPLARLSGTPRINVANSLPEYLEGKQVILLVTEKEYTQEVSDRLSKRVGREYVIDFKETGKGGVAEVIPYGIWKYDR